MKKRLFKIMRDLLDMSVLEMEYQYQQKTNPFGEKWLNSRRTRHRIHVLRKFLYDNIKLFLLESPYGEQFYNIALKSYFKKNHRDLILDLKDCPPDEMNHLYRTIYFRLTLDELFILLTNLITWEHMKYPRILESLIEQELVEHQKLSRDPETVEINEKLLRYYIRFLDVLSSPSIVSLFDLDALRHTINVDEKIFEVTPLEELHLFMEWPETNPMSFEERFPEFLQKMQKRNLYVFN